MNANVMIEVDKMGFSHSILHISVFGIHMENLMGRR